MLIRLGYAAICNGVDTTSSTPYTYNEFLNKKDYNKLDTVIKSNLLALEEIINYNIKNNIHFYRMSSKIIPLATKKEVVFDYINKYKEYYERIGQLINDNNMRVDFHAEQYCVLNSVNNEVFNNTVDELKYLYNILDALKIKNKLLILHVGSNVFGKENSIKRFVNNFNKLPNYLKESIAIENDDKIFNVEDVIKISKIINIPVILDYHHHNCNMSNFNIKDIFTTWNNIPKIHFSTPKNKKEYRSHNEYINVDDFIKFIEAIKNHNTNIDIMIEAKAKDDALFRLVRQLKYKTNYKFIDDTSFLI